MPPDEQGVHPVHQQGLSRTTMLTVIAITGGVLGIALLAFLTRRLCDTILAMREHHMSLPRTQPQPSRRRQSVLDSLSGFFIIPLSTATISWIRGRLLRRYHNRGASHHRSGSLRSVESDMRPMLESRASIVSRPREPVALPAPAHIASHHASTRSQVYDVS